VDDAPEEGLDEAAPARARSGTSLPIMILLVLVCLMMGANLYFTLTRKPEAAKPPPEEGTDEQPVKLVDWEASEEFGDRFSTKDNHLVQMSFALKVVSDDVATALTDRENELKDRLVLILMGEALDDVDPGDLKTEIKGTVDEMIGEADQVAEVLFSAFYKQRIPG